LLNSLSGWLRYDFDMLDPTQAEGSIACEGARARGSAPSILALQPQRLRRLTGGRGGRSFGLQDHPRARSQRDRPQDDVIGGVRRFLSRLIRMTSSQTIPRPCAGDAFSWPT